jgi:hypothetical protein
LNSGLKMKNVMTQRYRSSFRLFCCVVALCLLLTPLPIYADTHWTVSSGDWSASMNWTSGVPVYGMDTYIDNNGGATLNLPGAACRVLYVGDTAGSGTVDMIGGTLTWQSVSVGSSGNGIFTQSGGTSTTVNPYYCNLFLGANTGGNGIYNLSGTGQLNAWCEDVGYYGTGTFVQSGGINIVSCNLYLGATSSGSGSYSLSDDGLLSVDNQLIVGNNGGNGTFTQSGGTNTTYELDIAYDAGSTGTYELSGSGQLSTEVEFVGGTASVGSALFRQAGGTNTTSLLTIGKNGRYLLGGGILQINGGLANRGVLDGNGTLAAR